MIVYRVGRAKYAHDLKGEGAKLFGGRWNNKMVACVYTSESRALAVLEYSANVQLNDIPRALCITVIEIPTFQWAIIVESELPGNWKHAPAPSSTKDFGSKLLMSAKNPVIQIPSTIIPQENNYLLNPLHPDSNTFKILEISDFIYDVRVKDPDM